MTHCDCSVSVQLLFRSRRRASAWLFLRCRVSRNVLRKTRVEASYRCCIVMSNPLALTAARCYNSIDRLLTFPLTRLSVLTWVGNSGERWQGWKLSRIPMTMTTTIGIKVSVVSFTAVCHFLFARDNEDNFSKCLHIRRMFYVISIYVRDLTFVD